jgi:hypothetical protein
MLAPETQAVVPGSATALQLMDVRHTDQSFLTLALTLSGSVSTCPIMPGAPCCTAAAVSGGVFTPSVGNSVRKGPAACDMLNRASDIRTKAAKSQVTLVVCLFWPGSGTSCAAYGL